MRILTYVNLMVSLVLAAMKPTTDDIAALFTVFGVNESVEALSAEIETNEFAAIPEGRRTSKYLTPVFNTHHSETQMMRYLKQLGGKDFRRTV